MFKQSKTTVILILIIFGLGFLYLGIHYINNQKTSGQEVGNKPDVSKNELATFKSSVATISFLYPSSFFVEESKGTITVSPLSLEDPARQSSIAIASNLVINLRKDENLSNTPIRTQHGSMDFHEKATTFKGFSALLQSYTGAYAGEKNYVLLVEYSAPTISNGVIYIHHSEKYKDVYEKVIDSISFNN